MGKRLPLTERMTNKAFSAMIPLYVRNDRLDADHKCGGCFMRVPFDGDRSRCIIVHGEISLAHGTCNYWAGGRAASKPEDIHTMRMSKDSAGYVEIRGLINCSSCHFVGGDGEKPGMMWCKLWMKDVGPGDCCISHEARQASYLAGRAMSERWSRALTEGVGMAFTDRYDALGVPTPDPTTMCKGECEGTGWVPICEDDPDLQTEPWASLWTQAEAANPTDDGWHFVVCPTCEGTRLARPHEAHVAQIAEVSADDTPGVRAAKARVAEALKR